MLETPRFATPSRITANSADKSGLIGVVEQSSGTDTSLIAERRDILVKWFTFDPRQHIYRVRRINHGMVGACSTRVNITTP